MKTFFPDNDRFVAVIELFKCATNAIKRDIRNVVLYVISLLKETHNFAITNEYDFETTTRDRHTIFITDVFKTERVAVFFRAYLESELGWQNTKLIDEVFRSKVHPIFFYIDGRPPNTTVYPGVYASMLEKLVEYVDYVSPNGANIKGK